MDSKDSNEKEDYIEIYFYFSNFFVLKNYKKYRLNQNQTYPSIFVGSMSRGVGR